MAELVIQNGICAGTVFALPPGPVLVGRTPACQVQIADPWISSVHARLETRGGTVWVVDLASSNGTWLGTERVTEAPLPPGTVLRFGKTEAELREAVQARPAELDLPGALVQPVGEEVVFPASPTPRPGHPTSPGSEGGETSLANARRQIRVLNEIGRALVEATDVQSSLNRILETVSRVSAAERAVLLVGDAQGKMVPRSWLPEGEPPRVPRSLVEAAAQSRSGLVTLDAQQDLRFAASESVMAEGIRSCLCAPIWAEQRILGMIVLHRRVVEPFTASDLELCTVVGYQAALAIERARFLDRSQTMENERRKLLRHFSADVAQLILSGEEQAEDPLRPTERDDVTVLFSDIRGFTGLTERLPPLELASLLRNYFREMTQALFEQGGTLDKFIGDGLMAIFGAPVPMEDGAVRAVTCAWNMLQRLKWHNRRLPNDRQLQIRVGINTGKVIAGNVGAPDRLEFTVLGDTVNTASRLESVAEPGTICVGQRTMQLCQGAFLFEPLGEKQVKGRAAPVAVFKVKGPVATRSG